jgi:hypothetical protein
MRDLLEEEFATVVEIDFSRRSNYDFHAADYWCRTTLGPPDYQPRNTIANGKVGWWLDTVEAGGGWCTFQNTYFFRRASDALMFKLSV